MLKTVLVALSIFVTTTALAEPIEPYIDFGTVAGNLGDVASVVKKKLSAGGFNVIGEYSPAQKNDSARVVVFTRNDLIKALSLLPPKRGFAGALKVGLKKDDGAVRVTITNPELIFKAYLQKDYMKVADLVEKFGEEVVAVFSKKNGFSGEKNPMGGGDLDSEKVAKYHYMFGMEYFENQVTLTIRKTSHKDRIEAIEKYLANGKVNNVTKVFSISYPRDDGSKVSLYGVALEDKKKGEPFFLPIIGANHIAAMPYEFLVVDGKAYMLHGRYRIAIHWPALTMGTFTKIMSTPSDIKNEFKKVVGQ